MAAGVGMAVGGVGRILGYIGNIYEQKRQKKYAEDIEKRYNVQVGKYENDRDVARGGGDNPGFAFFPYYSTTDTGEPFETSVMWPELLSTYLSVSQPAGLRLEDLESLIGDTRGLRPVQDQALDLAKGVITGDYEKRLLSNIAPVQAARRQMGEEAVLKGIQDTLARTAQMAAGRGFTGDSMANMRIRQSGNTEAARQRAAATYDNAALEASRRDNAMQTQLASLTLPNQIALQNMQMALAYDQLPQQTLMNELMQRLAMLDGIRLPYNQAQFIPPVDMPYVPSLTNIVLKDVGNEFQQAGSMMGGMGGMGGGPAFGSTYPGAGGQQFMSMPNQQGGGFSMPMSGSIF